MAGSKEVSERWCREMGGGHASAGKQRLEKKQIDAPVPPVCGRICQGCRGRERGVVREDR